MLKLTNHHVIQSIQGTNYCHKLDRWLPIMYM